MKITLVLSSLIFTLISNGCTQSDTQPTNEQAEVVAWQTLSFSQDVPILLEVYTDKSQRKHGDRIFFEANLRDSTGEIAAQLIGMMTIADIPGDDSIGQISMEERFTTMEIIFPDGDVISITGANVYPVNQVIMQAQMPQQRVIVGGTGKYKGIRGQITTTRNDDETYTHVLEYRLD